MTGLGVAPASADPIFDSKALLANPTAPNGSRITKAEYKDDRNIRLYVYSAAMDQKVIIDVQRPADATVPRPALYLLNGAGGGQDDASWQAKTDTLKFLLDKNVNVIQPIGGKWSYYTDWIKDDPALGRNKWKTFFTEELPPLVDGALGTNGVNAIAGLSTSGTTVLALPIAKPGLYKAAAAYSGCAQTSDPVGSEFVRLTVETWGGGKTENMWGPPGSPEWAANDPYVHAEGLRGVGLYISTGNGLPGQFDTLNGPYALPGAYGLANQIIIGGIIEAGTNFCTNNLKNKLDSLGIPATFNFRPSGTHSWGYWREEFLQSWPVLARGMGI
ncbi:alpha/beta hydrolase [Nocardia altamirensis]|uniref:alpha/beta hydrolase n=1 Tax=Nocardia altamirensis TaxID=472158 RepID=UPI0008408BE5|nr:alpha/beta hydrolase family protein [Nocardia altamirensis]